MPSGSGSDQPGAGVGCQRSGPSDGQIGPLAHVARRFRRPPIVGQIQLLGDRLQPLEHRLIEIGVAGQLAELVELSFRLVFFADGVKHRHQRRQR